MDQTRDLLFSSIVRFRLSYAGSARMPWVCADLRCCLLVKNYRISLVVFTDRGTTSPFIARFKNWVDEWYLFGKQVRSIYVFATVDLPLLATKEELFASKFQADFAPKALYCMDELFITEHLKNVGIKRLLKTLWKKEQLSGPLYQNRPYCFKYASSANCIRFLKFVKL